MTTETIDRHEPLTVYCVPAESFPDGVAIAHKTLHTLVSHNPKRDYVGISWGGETITYMAGASELENGELAGLGLKAFTIHAGRYLSLITDSYERIGATFSTLLADGRIDPQGYCVELYQEDGLTRCMVTMKP